LFGKGAYCAESSTKADQYAGNLFVLSVISVVHKSVKTNIFKMVKSTEKRNSTNNKHENTKLSKPYIKILKLEYNLPC